MGSFSIWHWMVVLLVVLLLFGGGKVSSLMGDFAKGIKSFKKGLSEDEKAEDVPKVDPVKTIDHQPPSTAGTAMGSGAPATAGAPSDTRKVG
jgi:sec-independent protein translocase protein TatA